MWPPPGHGPSLPPGGAPGPLSQPPPLDSDPDEGGSLVIRFGTAVGLAAAAALVSALPAAMRLAVTWEPSAPPESTARIWTGLAAATLLPMVLAVFVLRGAREGLRSFGGPGAELRAYGVVLWVGSLFVALAFLGSVLRATTHNHALAGATFAFGALVLAVADALVCARIVAMLRKSSPDVMRGAALVVGLLGFAVIGFLGMRFLAALLRDPVSAPAAGMVVDLLAFALAALFAARPALASRRMLAIVGPPVAVIVAAMGLPALRDAPLRTAIQERAPAFAPVVDEVPGP